DPALLRPGRFDRQIVVPNPDILGREKILKVHMRKVPLGPDVDPRVVARGTPGFSGADLSNLVNEAALQAARIGKRVVTMADFEYAKDKVLMGMERRSMVMTEDEKKLTAYHEAGHAIVGLSVPKSEPLHKVTIIPRGRALGVTMQLPERDRYSYSKLELESKLAMMFGGRAAEEIVFGKENVTTGASNDIQQATALARRMVTEYGFSEKLGALRYADNEEEVFLGHSVAQRKNVSDATAQVIDEEVRNLVEAAEQRANDILNERRKDLDAVAQALLEYETLSGEEVGALLRGETISRPDQDDSADVGRKKRSSVPASGQGKERPGGSMEPEPQPGS
ncbi:MAG: cell division protein FtsH, partial [Rhodospirillales bacterium]